MSQLTVDGSFEIRSSPAVMVVILLFTEVFMPSRW